MKDFLIGTVLPSQIVNYLQKRGWELLPSKRKNVAYYQNTKDNVLYQVDIPLTEALLDYDYALDSVIKTVSKFYDEDYSITKLKLTYPYSDIIIVKIADDGLSINDIVNLYDGLKKIVKGGINDFSKEEQIHMRVFNYYKFVAEKNEYIAIISPNVMENNEVREINKHIFDSIYELNEDQNVADLYENYFEKNKKERKGILNALSDINLGQYTNKITFDIYYSPFKKEKEELKNNHIEVQDYKDIKRYASLLINIHSHETEIIGRVVGLRSDVPNKRSITVAYKDEQGISKKIFANVSEEDYEMAIDAHINKHDVVLNGTLSYSGRKMTNCILTLR